MSYLEQQNKCILCQKESWHIDFEASIFHNGDVCVKCGDVDWFRKRDFAEKPYKLNTSRVPSKYMEKEQKKISWLQSLVWDLRRLAKLVNENRIESYDQYGGYGAKGE